MALQRQVLEERVVSLLGAAFERGSWGLCRRAGAWLGLAFFNSVRRRREIAIANVRLVFPQLSEAAARQVARRSSQNFGMTFCEFLHLPAASAQDIRDYTVLRGFEHVQNALAGGHGAILSTAHFGNWEVMGARSTLEYPLTVVVRLTSNAALKQHIQYVRDAVGIKMMLKDESARGALQVLHDNGTVGIFPDQHPGDHGLPLPMFGHMTRVISAPARLALSAHAPIVPAFGVRRWPWLADGRIEINVFPGQTLRRNEYPSRDAAVEAGTRFIVSSVEQIVRRHPDQWLWVHRRWRPQDSSLAAS